LSGGFFNRLLGPDVLAFSLPAGSTCPGATDACARECYAKKGNFAWASTRARHEANYRAARRRSFVRRMVREIERRCGAVVRWHVSGDFFSPAYLRKVAEVVRLTPHVMHYWYTRSWRTGGIKPLLLRLAGEPNVRQWWSVDRDSGVPFPAPGGNVRFAWMLSEPEEERTHADLIGLCDLVFRTRKCRERVALKIASVTVCPVENGTPAGHATTCGACGICWKGGR
jgi:hypothetical protein